MPRLKVCPTPSCPALIPRTATRCADCSREYEVKRGTPAQRGYGSEHRRLRAHWVPIVAQGTVACARCHNLIPAGAPFDLDHTDDRSGYLGPSCVSCNRATSVKQTPPPPPPG